MSKNSNYAWKSSFHGEKAIWIKSGRYEAVLLPEIGANLVAFRDTENKFHFLREPSKKEMASFLKRPLNHGMPVLFPPNRYEDGKFPWKKLNIHLPINEPSRNNHLHGFLYKERWVVEEYGNTANESFVIVSINVDSNHPIYDNFPFEFNFRLRYSLSEDGLLQHVTIRNNGKEGMPCLLAFHTALNVPFALKSKSEDYRVKITVGESWKLNNRMLPLEMQKLSEEDEKMRDEGIYPFFEPMDNHYTAASQDGRNRMELTDTISGKKLIYDVGNSYKYWMIWNNCATEGFFCAEPQSNLVNAPNVKLPSDTLGLHNLPPNEIWEETSRLYMKN